VKNQRGKEKRTQNRVHHAGGGDWWCKGKNFKAAGPPGGDPASKTGTAKHLGREISTNKHAKTASAQMFMMETKTGDGATAQERIMCKRTREREANKGATIVITWVIRGHGTTNSRTKSRRGREKWIQRVEESIANVHDLQNINQDHPTSKQVTRAKSHKKRKCGVR